jgi:hypothetical protein
VFPCQRLHVGAQIECQSVAVGSTIAEGRARARSAQQIHDILVALLKGNHPRGFVEIILSIYIGSFLQQSTNHHEMTFPCGFTQCDMAVKPLPVDIDVCGEQSLDDLQMAFLRGNY